MFYVLLQSTTPSVDDLVPLVVIFILILAAAGMTKGADIFSFFGVGTLLGVIRPGGGAAGKGIKAGKGQMKTATTAGVSAKAYSIKPVYTSAKSLGKATPASDADKATLARQMTNAQNLGYGLGEAGFVTMSINRKRSTGTEQNEPSKPVVPRRLQNRLISQTRRTANANQRAMGLTNKADLELRQARSKSGVRGVFAWRRATRGLGAKRDASDTGYVFTPFMTFIPIPVRGSTSAQAVRAQQQAQREQEKLESLMVRAAKLHERADGPKLSRPEPVNYTVEQQIPFYNARARIRKWYNNDLPIWFEKQERKNTIGVPSKESIHEGVIKFRDDLEEKYLQQAREQKWNAWIQRNGIDNVQESQRRMLARLQARQQARQREREERDRNETAEAHDRSVEAKKREAESEEKAHQEWLKKNKKKIDEINRLRKS